MSLPAYAVPGDPQTAPFLIEVGVGEVVVAFGKGLAPSGLLLHLPLELLPVLLALLCLVDRAGEVHASPIQVAKIVGIHPDDAEVRLSRLAAFPSTEQPLVYLRDGMYSLSKQYIVPVVQSLSLVEPEQETYRPVHRDEVIERSRARYATPRHEAERMIEEQLGIEPLPEGMEGEVLQGLLNVGVSLTMGRELIAAYPLARIQAQLHWLPNRAARNPARYLVSAIQGDFGPPGPPQGVVQKPPQSPHSIEEKGGDE